MRDSLRSQTLEACGGMKSAANLLRYLISVHKLKAKEWPHEAPTSHHLWVKGSYPYLASKIDVNWRTVMRAVRRLESRGFIKVHVSPSDDTNSYEVDIHCVERWTQRLDLFERDRLNDDTPCQTPCHLTPPPPVTVTPPPCHRDTTPPVSMTPPPLICAPIYPIITTIDDVERTCLLEEMRRLGVVTEQAELWMTKYTRPLIQTGIEYVRGRMGKERIDNPGGLLNSFLQNPGLRGYEMDIQGQWHRVGSKPKPSQYKPPPVDPEWKARYEASEEKRKREASAARERRLHAEVVPVGE